MCQPDRHDKESLKWIVAKLATSVSVLGASRPLKVCNVFCNIALSFQSGNKQINEDAGRASVD